MLYHAASRTRVFRGMQLFSGSWGTGDGAELLPTPLEPNQSPLAPSRFNKSRIQRNSVHENPRPTLTPIKVKYSFYREEIFSNNEEKIGKIFKILLDLATFSGFPLHLIGSKLIERWIDWIVVHFRKRV